MPFRTPPSCPMSGPVPPKQLEDICAAVGAIRDGQVSIFVRQGKLVSMSIVPAPA